MDEINSLIAEMRDRIEVEDEKRRALEEASTARYPAESWRAIDIRLRNMNIDRWRWIWGLDIFINDVPMIKLFAAVNVVVWVIMWVMLRWG